MRFFSFLIFYIIILSYGSAVYSGHFLSLFRDRDCFFSLPPRPDAVVKSWVENNRRSVAPIQQPYILGFMYEKKQKKKNDTCDDTEKK